jgi:hypothetical protein
MRATRLAFAGFLMSNCPRELGFRQTPVPINGLCRNAEDGGDFGRGKPPKMSHLYHLRFPRIELRQFLKRIVNFQHLRAQFG